METISIIDLTNELLEKAKESSAGRAAKKVAGGPETRMTQTIVALTAGTRLDDHENPGEATVQVLAGKVSIGTTHKQVSLGLGQLLTIPDLRHNLEALTDAVVLLTAVKRA